MTDLQTPEPETTLSTMGMSRRTIGKAAWIAPAIVVASQAPVFAASGPAALAFGGTSVERISLIDLEALNLLDVELSAPCGLAVTSSVRNNNTQDTTAFQVTMTLVNQKGGILSFLYPQDLEGTQASEVPGFTLASASGTGAGNTRTWVYTAIDQLGHNETIVFNPQIFMSGQLYLNVVEGGQSRGTVTLTATTSTGSGANTVAQYD